MSKPKFTEPCNNCGLCCSLQLCFVAEVTFGKDQVPPCPALTMAKTCGLVEGEARSGLPPMLEKALGIGCGCSMPDDDTTEEEVGRFHNFSKVKMYGEAAP